MSTSASKDAVPAPPSSSKPSPFGAATPVDTVSREAAKQERLEKERASATEKSRTDPTPSLTSGAESSSSSPRKASNPFGDAKPVDISAREKEVEEKLMRDREDMERKMADAKIAEEKSASPKKEWRRPAGPNAGFTDSPANAPQSEVSKPTSPREATERMKSPTSPKPINKNQGLRKEGFSYSNVAGKGSATSPSRASAPLELANGFPNNGSLEKGNGEKSAEALDTD